MIKSDEAFRYIRLYNKLSQIEASKKLKISKSYICQIEKGDKKPTLNLIARYAKCFKLTLVGIVFLIVNVKKQKEYTLKDINDPTVVKILNWIHSN